MDSDCERLVDEMWQSYLCEENLGSFYEPPTFGLHLNNQLQLGTEALDQEDVDLVNSVLGVQDYWEPLEDMFGLLEEMMMFEEHNGECTLCDQPNDQQEAKKHICKNTTTEISNPTVSNKNETENGMMMNSNHGTSTLKQSKRKRSKNTSDHNGEQKKKKTANKQ